MPVMNEPLSRIAQYVHRIVFGDGPIPMKPLSRIEWLLAYAIEKGISGIKEGYYYNGQFYKDEEHIELLEPTEGGLYYDKTGKKLYLYDGTNYTEVGSGGSKPYLSLERLNRYLYEVSFLEVPEYIDANDSFAACSSYVKDGKLYRNLDWNYDNTATFKFCLPGMEGTSFINGLTDTTLNDTLIGQLPYHMVDGVNEHGIMASTHVLFNDFNYANDGNTPLSMLPYLVLKNVKSMATIADDLEDVLGDLKPSAGMVASEYLIQLLVTDGMNTCVIRPTDDGTYEVANATSNPKLTNFRWVADPTVVRTNLQARPTGVERWNLMPTDLENLRYTKCYEAPDRLSEFIGIDDTTKDTPDDTLQTIYNGARTAYLNRERDGVTWQTIHSAVYNQNGLEHLWIQENWDKDYVITGGGTEIMVNGIVKGDGTGAVSAAVPDVDYQTPIQTDEATEVEIDTTVTEDSSNLITSGAVYEAVAAKQDKLIAGENITIEGNVISASGGGGGLPPKLTVTTKALAMITATLGTTVLTKTANADGIAVFELPAYGVWNLSVTDGTETQVGSVTVDTVKEYAIIIRLGRIFGVEWGRTSSPVWTRTDDAELFTDPVSYVAGMEEGEWGSPFDDAMPWAGMVRTTDAEAGELVAIPKFYYKWTNTAEKMKLQISASPQPGFLTSPAHIDRGDGKGERDVVYVGRYHCAASDYKSRGGEKPKVNIKRATARDAIAAIGDDIWQLDHALWWTIDMLYLVEYANANCQDVIGYGRGNNSAVENMGYTDSMPYHTGTMLGSKTTYGCSTQYRNIEGLWDNCLDWCDGIYFSNANIYHILNPSQFSDNSNGTFTGSRATATTKVITGFTFPSVEGYEWAGYPAESDVGAAGTTGTDYFCDNEYSGGTVLTVGGYYNQSQISGLFYRGGNHNVSDASAYVGSRLQKLP